MICARCSEPMVNPAPDKLCGFWRGELREAPVSHLFSPRPHRTFAIWHLREQGCTAEAVVGVVKAALRGSSREELEGLLEVAALCAP